MCLDQDGRFGGVPDNGVNAAGTRFFHFLALLFGNHIGLALGIECFRDMTADAAVSPQYDVAGERVRRDVGGQFGGLGPQQHPHVDAVLVEMPGDDETVTGVVPLAAADDDRAAGTGGQLFWTRALRLGEVSALQPISFMQLPLVTALAWVLFDETVSAWTIAGAAIIFAAAGYIAHREAQLSRRAATTAPVEAAKPGE